ncbi:Tn3 family transposase [[Kitasatospora] papulosa]|uniref:Tn3 family transposase n=1 Tax=[Kitasatospora] papulosa TaxID=1464011 RepID=UPI003690D60D
MNGGRARDAARHHHGRRGQLHDSQGRSAMGFGITRLLNFDLLPRIKRINKVKLYRPVASQPDSYSRLAQGTDAGNSSPSTTRHCFSDLRTWVGC